MALKFPKQSIRWIIGGVILLLFLNMSFGSRGFIALYKQHKICRDLEDSIALENERIDSLALVEKRLQEDPVYIERAARELLGVSRPGETVIKFVDIE